MHLKHIFLFFFLFASSLLFAGESRDRRGAQIELDYANTVYFKGQGLIADGFGGYDLRTEICGIENGADVDGPYLLWVLTATKARYASIQGPWGTAQMTKVSNGTFKYISSWYDPDNLNNVLASYDGRATNVQLTISHGCRPFERGAWCSPGFWRNATNDAWSLTGFSRSDLFNVTVYSGWFGSTFLADPSLQGVLDQPQIYSGPSVQGTSGYSLNAFNATGAMLTHALPNYDFDFTLMQSGSSDSCPIDHFGNWK